VSISAEIWRAARTKKNKNQNDEPNVNLNPNGER